jgi:hypothetical protein
VTVVLGASGSGKSTLARVLLGIWPHTSGEVLLDGKPMNRWDRMELGPHIGYLPQDIELFDGSIAENIARSGEVDSEKVIAAATAAGLHTMILRFPKGYDTPMGEAGGLLSGGQRQRVGLARALYGERRDHHSLDNRMRVLLHEKTIFKCPRLALIRVADDVGRLSRVPGNEAPFHSSGEAGATTSSDTGLLDLLDDSEGIHRERFFDRLVSTTTLVPSEGLLVWLLDVL